MALNSKAELTKAAQVLSDLKALTLTIEDIAFLKDNVDFLLKESLDDTEERGLADVVGNLPDTHDGQPVKKWNIVFEAMGDNRVVIGYLPHREGVKTFGP